jgi:glycosyltransferase involved in cell wall biosynthesis
MKEKKTALIVLNQMAGPLTWELAEDVGRAIGQVALLTGHPDTLARGGNEHVHLFPAAPYRRGSYARRVVSWVRYLVRAFFWMWKWPARTPVLLFSNPPMLAWLGYLMWMLRGQRYAVMVHDIYPDLLIRLGAISESHPVTRIWRWLNRKSYEHAEMVMTLGEYMSATLSRGFDPLKTRAGRIEVVYPWADTELIRPLAKSENWFAERHGQVDKLTVMYSGNMGLGHDIETMLEAAEQLRGEPKVHFMFIGAGPKWQVVEDRVREKKLTNVTLLPWQSEEVVPYSLTTADLALVSLEEEMAGLAVPSKAFSSLAAGVPLVVVCSRDTELASMIKRFDCGRMIHPGQPEELTAMLCGLISNPRELEHLKAQSRRAAEKIGSRANSEAFVNIINHVLLSGSPMAPDVRSESRKMPV